MKIEAFNQFAVDYDRWFDTYKLAYLSELEAVKKFIPSLGIGIEVGTGTGRFSVPFGIKIGVEPAKNMATIAHSRGINVISAFAENLPFDHNSIDFALMITTLCFVDNPLIAIQEIFRILKPNGIIIIGIIDKESELGRKYESMKIESTFYNDAIFYSTNEVTQLLVTSGFVDIKACQTIFSNPSLMIKPDFVIDNYGQGSFVVLSALKLG
jgi:ubiquinone/menaquinone biosynthesis C-methylase UbiE